MTVTFDQVRELVDRLAPGDRQRLATYLAQTTTAVQDTGEPGEAFRQRNLQAWQKLLAFHATLAADYPQADVAAQLDRDRQERDTLLRRAGEG
ncbi:MAG: hypothetical protein K6T87_21450 [Roseiflexus sp.]|uniref:hypothetical protein n=1 Tax=Roseiflexus sp. TaxID=2562120 RepID=UPI0025EF5F3F|nr:hypothetical protein [Roseiflexus sp.]MCL6543126.1 hypothetical protein [Roseiflexus sp.]